MIRVYAIVPRATRLPRQGVARGRRLRVIRGATAAAVVADAPAPVVSLAALRAHDRVVRGITRCVASVLPVRFGTTFASAGDVAARLGADTADWRAALRDVRQREQMTLRVYGAPAARRGTPTATPRRTRQSGTAYLRQRADRIAEARRAPELDPLRQVLAGIIAAERVARHDRGTLLLTAYHLIGRGAAGEYRRTLATAMRQLGLRASASGPWPPYAFAPELIA